jgi:hypothetical protein
MLVGSSPLRLRIAAASIALISASMNLVSRWDFEGRVETADQDCPGVVG